MKKILITILFITISSELLNSQEFFRDTIANFSSKNLLIDIVSIKDTLWFLNDNKLVRYSNSKFIEFGFNEYSHGDIWKYENNNQGILWDGLATNTQSLILYSVDNTLINIMSIKNGNITNKTLNKNNIINVKDLCVDDQGFIWFIGYSQKNFKTNLCYTRDDKLNYFIFPDSLENYKLNNLICENDYKYAVLTNKINDSLFHSLLVKINSDTIISIKNIAFQNSKKNTLVYNIYLDSDVVYLLNNLNNLIIVDSDTKCISIGSDDIGECFSFIKYDNSIYCTFTKNNNDITINKYDLINFKKTQYTENYIYNRGIKKVIIYQRSLIGLSGGCANDQANRIFRFKFN